MELWFMEYKCFNTYNACYVLFEALPYFFSLFCWLVHEDLMNILDISFFFLMACMCECFLFIHTVAASFFHEINSSTSPFLFTWMWWRVISFPLSFFWYHVYWCGCSTRFYISMRPRIDWTLACTWAIYFGAATFPFLYLILRRYPFFYTTHFS